MAAIKGMPLLSDSATPGRAHQEVIAEEEQVMTKMSSE